VAARRNSPARRGAPRSRPRVADLLAAIEQFAPLAGAESWDNVGLLAGDPSWPAARVLAAIDLTDAVAREALDRKFDAVLAYHPPIFKGIRSVSPAAEGPTSRLADLLAARISIVALHTALDAAPGGTNDVLLDLFDTVERRPLSPRLLESRAYKLVVFVPAAEVDRLREALGAAGAGRIGDYDLCSYALDGRGTFRGGDRTNPTIGRRGRLESVDEVRLEMVVPRARLADVVRALYATHSYEEPAFDVYPVHELADRGASGAGRVARLTSPQRGRALLERLRAGVDLRGARVVGDLKRRFEHVAAAAGSFGVRDFRDPSCLYLTGEFKHHDALDLLRRGVVTIALSHYASERPALACAAGEVQRRTPGCRVHLARRDADPLQPI